MAWADVGKRGKGKPRIDNDHLASKVALRLEGVTLSGKPREVYVLDAFAGFGHLWDAVRLALPEGWSVRLYQSDNERKRAGTLKVDNVRLLEAINLRRFDLIDLDAYGWPANQLKIVSQRAPKVPVVSTRIARALGPMPKVVLDDLGITIPKHGPKVLYETIADELWEAWLYRLGYRTSRLIRFDHNDAAVLAGDSGRMPGIIKRYELLIP